jgi:hypothetical protein
MPFTNGPNLLYMGRGKYRTVGETEYEGKTDTIRIPSGFATDLASVPRIFWVLLPPDGTYERAAVLHDALCVWLAQGVSPIDARDTDGLFRRVAREGGTGLIACWLLWVGVRWGALFNPARRPGWWRDAVPVLAITAVLLALVLAVVVGVDALIHPLLAAL